MGSNLSAARYLPWRYDMDANGHRIYKLGNPVFDHEPVRLYDIERDAWGVSGIWTFANGIKTNTVDERTLNAGVTVDGVLIKDGLVDGGDVSDLNTKMTLLYTTIGLSALTAAEVDQLENIGSVTISFTQWNYLGQLDQGLTTTHSPTFAGLTLNGDLNMSNNNILNPGTIGGFDAGGDIDLLDTYSLLNVATITIKEDGWIGSTDGYLLFDYSGTRIFFGSSSEWDLDMNSNNIINAADIEQLDGSWIGMGAAKGRLVWTDAATDLITVTAANLRLDGTNVLECNAATEGVYSGAAGYMDYKAATAHRFTTLIDIVATTSTAGQITQAGARLLHTFGENTFVGLGAGNLSLNGASNNVGVGEGALDELSTGDANIGIGVSALGACADGSTNIAIGSGALLQLTAADENVAIGANVLESITSGGEHNTGIGHQALQNITTGDNHTAVGYRAGHSENSASGGVFLGYLAGYYETAADKLFVDNAMRASEADGRVKALVYGVFDAAVANQSVMVNGLLSSSYGASFGDGGTTHYTAISATGVVTLHGDARYIGQFDVDLSIPKRPAANPPAEGTLDGFPTLDFDDGTDESVYLSLHLNHGYAAAGLVRVHIDFLVDTAPAAPANVVWGCEYKKVSHGDIFTFLAGTSLITVTEAITTGTPANDQKIHETSALAFTTAGWVPGDTLYIRFYRDADNGADTFTGDARIIGKLHLEWLADQHGEPL